MNKKFYCSKDQKPEFGYAHFPVGTVFKFQVKGVDPVEQIAKVRALSKNGPDSYVVHTNLACEVSDYRFVNISHVTGIIRRGPGVAKLPFDQTIQDVSSYGDSLLKKSKSHYRLHSMHTVVSNIVTGMANQDQIVDVEKMVVLLRAQNVIQTVLYSEDCEQYSVYGYKGHCVASKKKLKSAIKRLFNKCLCDHGAAQRESDSFWDSGWHDGDYDD